MRLRQLHPVRASDGACTMLYDLERTFVVPVPPELRHGLDAVLEGEEPSRDVSDWLRSEELVTEDARPDRSDAKRLKLPVVTDVSLDLSGACNMGCVYCFEDDIDSRLGPMSADVMHRALELAFRNAGEARRVVLHFGSGEPLLRFATLVEVVAEAERRAAAAGKTVGYELTTNATLVTPEIAAFLAAHRFNVRVSCDGPARIHDRFRPLVGGKPSYPAVERGLGILLEHLPDRVTVNSVLAHPTRLRELWAWAKGLGLRRYHVIKVGAHEGRDVNLQAEELARFVEDLGAVSDELFDEVEAGRTPIDYQPITKVVRRLMIPEPITRFCGVASSYLGVASNGKVYPCFRHLGLPEYHLGDVQSGTIDDEKRRAFLGHEAADVDARPVCRDCWARYLCGGGCYADSTVYGPDRGRPQVHHCPFWRAEIEAAIRLYGRLVDADPLHCIRLFGDDPDALLSGDDDQPEFTRRKNCA